MVLRFDGKKGDEAEFELLNAGQAIGAVQSCIRQQSDRVAGQNAVRERIAAASVPSSR